MNNTLNRSSYHSFKKGGKYFLYEINKMAIFEISELCYKITKNAAHLPINKLIAKYKKYYGENEIKNAYLALEKWGMIRKDPNIADDNVIKPFIVNKNQNNEHTIHGMYLTISQDCNLRCKYCSAGYGTFGDKKYKGLMSEEIALKSINFLLSSLDKEITNPLITFVGGEPLLNFKIIKLVVEFIKGNTNLKPNYLFNTNGTLLNDEISKWLVENEIPIRISIDGTREIHNSNRVFSNGKGSYDRVLKGLEKYVYYNKNGFSVQTSIPHGHAIVKSVHNIWKLGADHVLAHMTSDSAFLDTREFTISNKDWNRYNKGIEKLNSEIINNFISKGHSPTIHNSFDTIKRLFKHQMRYMGCGVLKVISVDNIGRFYPCQGLVGFQSYMIGDLYKGFNYEAIKKFDSLYIQYMNRCNNCWARNLCGSACIAQSIQYDEMDEEFEPSRWCNAYKKEIESSIYFYNVIYQKKTELLRRLFE